VKKRESGWGSADDERVNAASKIGRGRAERGRLGEARVKMELCSRRGVATEGWRWRRTRADVHAVLEVKPTRLALASLTLLSDSAKMSLSRAQLAKAAAAYRVTTTPSTIQLELSADLPLQALIRAQRFTFKGDDYALKSL
jgi:hypothetical protein